MIKPLGFIIIGLFFSILTQAQSSSIYGKAIDTLENIRLYNASIVLLRSKDSVLVGFSRAKTDGSFVLKAPSDGKYIFLITYPGYADHVDFIDIKGETHLGDIVMLTKAVVLQNVIVRGSAVRMKGDTLSFLADSFKVQEGATVEDLLKRLPGLTVDSKGQISAQGQRVQKVLVDGDEFFGDDPTLATRNLQANAVKEVQVFDKKSDQATFTGVDDGNSQKTINLKLKDEFKRGHFGKVKLGGGLPERWENQAMINAFKDKRKLSVYGIMANTNNNALGWSEENQFGGNINNNMQVGDDGSIMIFSQADEFGGSGGYNGEGLPTTLNLGTSYANKWNENRSSMNGAYRFQHLQTEANTTVRTQNILPDTQFFNNENSKNLATRMRHRVLARSELFIDSAQSLTFNLTGSYGQNTLNNQYQSEALNGKQMPVNKSYRTTSGESENGQFSANVLYKLKLKKPRRTLSVNFSNQYSNLISDGFLFTANEFYDENGLFRKDTVDQKKENFGRSVMWGGRAAYSEPVGKNGIVEVNYGFSLSDSREERLSFDKVNDKYESLNELFSNDFSFKNIVNRTGAGYRFNGKKLQYGFGGDVAFTDWQQEDLFRDTTRKYSFTNIFPRANLSYKLGQYSSIRLNYNGSTRAPTANQLQPVADNNDPLNIVVGNPDLVQSFNHNINFGFNQWKPLNNNGMWMGIWFNPTANAFSTRNVVDAFGRRVTQTVNVDGNYTLGGYMGYNFKWKKPDIDVAFSLDPSFSRLTNFINGVQNQTISRNIGFSTSLFKQKDKKYSVHLDQAVNYNFSESSISPETKTEYFTTRSEFNLSLFLPKGFTLQTDMQYNWRERTDVFDQNNNAFIWNASFEKKVSKKQDMRLGFRMNDILNQNIGFQRNISSNFVSERTYDVIRRYWLLTLHWNFNKGQQKADEGW
ncbi:MAG: outer membrane beta-barrel family protein [Chitinophagaceae bacterium]|nr:outer membrane beta-barrel family protein [Chitinophagaceae bacterium]